MLLTATPLVATEIPLAEEPEDDEFAEEPISLLDDDVSPEEKAWYEKRSEIMGWLLHYHQHPNPDSVAQKIQEFSEYGYLNDARSSATLLGFAWQLFQKNDDYLERWMEVVHHLPYIQQVPFVFALHLVETPTAWGIIDNHLTDQGDEGSLYHHINNLDRNNFYTLEGLQKIQPNQLSPETIPLCIGAYYASGDLRFLDIVKNYATSYPPTEDKTTTQAVLEIILNSPISGPDNSQQE